MLTNQLLSLLLLAFVCSQASAYRFNVTVELGLKEFKEVEGTMKLSVNDRKGRSCCQEFRLNSK